MIHANQLQFNLDFPVNPRNLQAEFSSPSAIMYERITPRNESPITKAKPAFAFRLVSRSKLSNAILLAKRDVKLAKRQNALREFAAENGLEDMEMSRSELKEKKMMNTSVCVLLPEDYKKTKKPKSKSKAVKSTIPKQNSQKPLKEQQEILDIKRLRLEIQQAIFTLEKTHEDKRVFHAEKLMMLDQEEEQKLVVRHLEQMRQHSRTVYNLHQQVHVIKEDLKKAIPDAKPELKARILSRVAATHRGTYRLLQLYCPQLPEHSIFPDNFVAVAALFQEVSRLITELSLCALQLSLTNIEEVERISEALKNTEPKHPVPPTRIAIERTPRSASKKVKSPRRSFKSKNVHLVKKSFTQQRLPRPSFSTPKPQAPADNLLKEFEAVDLIDRPEWRPPSNSPYKNVGPPSLGPLLETPSPRHQAKPKVTFFNAQRENDVDAFQEPTPRDLEALKSKLADELEKELKSRIQPLLQKVDELAKSAEATSQSQQKDSQNEILKKQIEEITQETKNEMEEFQKQQYLEETAVQLRQRPTIETLLTRLDAIAQEEEAIRRNWRQINYEDFLPKSPSIEAETVPKTPQAFEFIRTTGADATNDPPITIMNLLPREDKEAHPQGFELSKVLQSEIEKQRFNGATLTIPQSTFKAIKRGKKNFEKHLKRSFHEPKGNFNPWKLVEELSDDILDEVVSSVTKEVNEMCEHYADEIFKGEFADAPNLTDSSIMTTESSLFETPAR